MFFNEYLKVVLLSGLTVLFLSGIVIAADEGEQEMQHPYQYFVRLLGTRDDWPDNMTADEEKVMQEHFVYLQTLLLEKKVIIAGPVDAPPFGLIILQTESEEEAVKIMDDEPSVYKGVHNYEMQPMHISLLVENFSTQRYAPDPSDKILIKEVIVNAPLDMVWRLWTTTQGVQSFFASKADVALRIGGPYEIYFDRSAPRGQQGSEECRVLSFLPMEMLSFEWNAPPKFKHLRKMHTQVILQFEELERGQVRVKLSHLGWGTRGEWNEVYAYFDKAWAGVLANFEKRITEGPIKWQED